MSKNDYEHRWLKGERLGKGGQGLTYHCKNIPEDGGTYVLKILKEQRVKERRERMFVEVSALRILQNKQIPKLIDSNVSDYENNNKDLYLVTEYIPGPTLESFIEKNGPLELSDAISLILQLADIVAFCHSKGFSHRDIKPDNVILRDGDLNNPYLIDFGLSFNEDIEKDATPSWQHIGNRFLSLPELRVRESNKKDPRSDITMLVGILLYLLSGVYPTDLMDENRAMPHRRERSKVFLEKIGKPKLAALNRLFDIGFNLGINDRWQSIASLKESLIDISNIQTIENMEESDAFKKLEQYKQAIEQRADFKQLGHLQTIFRDVYKVLDDAVKYVLKQLAPARFGSTQTGYNVDFVKQVFTNTLGIRHSFSDKLSFIPKFTCYTNGSELIIEASEGNKTEELLRHPLNVEINWKSLEEKIIVYYINGITSKEE